MSNALADILEARQDMVRNGDTADSDDARAPGILAVAGACYALIGGGLDAGFVFKGFWPFDAGSFRPHGSLRGLLVKAAALIVAEIDKIDRETARETARQTERRAAFLEDAAPLQSPTFTRKDLICRLSSKS